MIKMKPMARTKERPINVLRPAMVVGSAGGARIRAIR